ncbi:hypothetical protein FKB34_00020 [Glycocaulis profundi]|nr:hypothetical protein FKB34_00020 [Glycocaulis profundi]
MALRPKDIANLEAAGMPPGVIRYVAREAEGLWVLPVLRMFHGWKGNTALFAFAALIPLLLRTGADGWYGSVAFLLPLVFVMSAVWLRNRSLRLESPAQWSARRIAMAAVGGDPKGELKRHVKRLDPALPPRAALAKMARKDWKGLAEHGPQARPESPVPASWPRQRLIATGLVAVPAVIVLAIPIAVWILMR